ncbi:MAG: UDP-N-acetylmuramate dehydrogenase [Clostridiales bacterium]|nr:UDP-N-acetylmuramate dehydrogenase [Clostridiales bacterium]
MSLIEEMHSHQIQFCLDEPMRKHTSFRIGGPADYFISPADEEALMTIISLLRQEKIPYFIAGNLSNVVFDDAGYRGAVISTERLNHITHIDCTLHCGCGVNLSVAANTAYKHALTGLEFAYGIPGTIGGGIYMNAGAYGSEMANIVDQVCCFDSAENKVKTFLQKDCQFGYRSSIFQHSELILLSTILTLQEGEKKAIKEKMDTHMSARKSKQPLSWPNAGSVFKRPQGHFAGAMIEELGLKGASVGGAAVSEKHAGFIINTGNATCSDVKELVAMIQEKVYSAYGISLECEIQFVAS